MGARMTIRSARPEDAAFEAIIGAPGFRMFVRAM